MHGTSDVREEKMAGSHVELLTYPAYPEPPAQWSWLEANQAFAEQENAVSARLSRGVDSFEERLADEKTRSFEAGRERGQAEGRQAEREACAAAEKAIHAQSARQAAELLSRFAEERDRYMRSVEHEVVKLALAIAARILRREAQMDPLLLTGAVRVALGQLVSTAEVRVIVPADDLDLWSDALAHLPSLPIRPTVQAGEGMRLGECTLETTLGSVDLGIRSQLAEIEHGFFDRMPMSAGRKPAQTRIPEKNA